MSTLKNMFCANRKLTKLTMSQTLDNNCVTIKEHSTSQIIVIWDLVLRKFDNFWSICKDFDSFWLILSPEKSIGDSLTQHRVTVALFRVLQWSKAVQLPIKHTSMPHKEGEIQFCGYFSMRWTATAIIFTSQLFCHHHFHHSCLRRLAQGRTPWIERSGPHVRVLSRLRHSIPVPFWCL